MAEKKKEQAVAATDREFIEQTLKATDREGMDDLLTFMAEIGFYEAPASGGNHMSEQGGLAKHTVNVMQTAEKIGVALYGGDKYNTIQHSVMIAAALHDLGKCGDHGKKMYVENILKSGKPSAAKPFKRNPELLALDHATRSLTLAWRFIDLTEDEEFAIRYHDGLYETANYGVKGHETPLYMILHWADMWASKVIEGNSGESGESEE